MDHLRDEALDIPEWLVKSDNYIPQSDKDTFVNKSILSVLRVLSRIKMQEAVGRSKFNLNVPFKVFFTFILLLLLSITRSFIFVIIVNVYLLLILSSMDAVYIIKILKMSLGVTLLTAVIMMPAMLWGNSYSCIMITSKVYSAVTVMGLLSHTTKWGSITYALKKFYVPNIFILILDITIKYIYMMGNFTLNMLYALKLRSIGKNHRKYASMAGIAGTMFLQSKELAEDMYHAMECRGFSGEYYIYEKLKFEWIDYIYIVIHICFLLLFFYFERI